MEELRLVDVEPLTGTVPWIVPETGAAVSRAHGDGEGAAHRKWVPLSDRRGKRA